MRSRSRSRLKCLSVFRFALALVQYAEEVIYTRNATSKKKHFACAARRFYSCGTALSGEEHRAGRGKFFLPIVVADFFRYRDHVSLFAITLISQFFNRHLHSYVGLDVVIIICWCCRRFFVSSRVLYDGCCATFCCFQSDSVEFLCLFACAPFEPVIWYSATNVSAAFFSHFSASFLLVSPVHGLGDVAGEALASAHTFKVNKYDNTRLV